METIFAFISSYFANVFEAIATFAATSFAEQPFAWLAAWVGCVATGLLIGWSIVADDQR